MVIGVCDRKEVGIDIQKIKDINFKIAERYFTNNEYKFLNNRSRRIDKFYEIWTKKESFIKAIGKGLGIALQSYDVQNNPIIYKNENYFTQTVYIAEDYIAAICTKTNENEFEIVELNVEELLSKFN